MEQLGVGFGTIVFIIVVIYLLSSIKILAEYERGVIFRLGRLFPAAKVSRCHFCVRPDRSHRSRFPLRQEALEVPPQDIVADDNVTLKVNAVSFLRVIEPRKAVVEVLQLRLPNLAVRTDPRFAPCSANRNSTNYSRIATRSICACKASSIRTLRLGA